MNYKYSGSKCHACDTKDHILENCKKIHFTVDRAKVAQKYCFYTSSKSRCFFPKKRNFKINSRLIFQRVKFAQENFVSDNLENLFKEEEDEEEQNESQIEENKTCKTIVEKIDESTDSPPIKVDDNKRSVYFSGSSNTNRTKTKEDIHISFKHHKKYEESSLDVLFRDFETIKDYQNYYPHFNIDNVLRKYLNESGKSKKSRKTHNLISKNRKAIMKKQILNSAKSRDL